MPNLVFENIPTGTKTVITGKPTTLKSIGPLPTIRLDVAKGIYPAVKWSLRINGKPVKDVPDWTDPFYPFRIIAGDRGLPTGLVGTGVVTCQPVDGSGNNAGPAFIAPINIVPGGLSNDTEPLPTVPGNDQEEPTFDFGFAGNITDPTVGTQNALKRLGADGGRVLRLWESDFGPIDPRNMKLVDDARAAGVTKTTLLIQVKDDPTKKKIINLGKPNLASFVALNAPAMLKIDSLELFNEVEWEQYRPNDLGTNTDNWHKPYVDRVLGPLSQAIEAAKLPTKITLCSLTAVSGKNEHYLEHGQKLLDAGAKGLFDRAAMHVYYKPDVLPKVAKAVADYKALMGGVPIDITEGNLHETTPQASMPALMPQYIAALRQGGANSIAFYRGLPSTASRTAVFGKGRVLFDSNGVPDPVLYPAFLKACTA